MQARRERAMAAAGKFDPAFEIYQPIMIAIFTEAFKP